ncbi:MAG: hypothetical protein ACOC0N_00965 [Chroococcales cyanobacterium]
MIQSQPNSFIEQLMHSIWQTGQVSRQEQFQLMTLFLSDWSLTDEERHSINHVFDELQMGRLKLVD